MSYLLRWPGFVRFMGFVFGIRLALKVVPLSGGCFAVDAK